MTIRPRRLAIIWRAEYREQLAELKAEQAKIKAKYDNLKQKARRAGVAPGAWRKGLE